MSFSIKKVVVIGAGTMGSGIAQWFAQQEVAVELIDNNEELTKAALKNIFTSWEKLESKGKFSKENVSTFKSLIKSSDIKSFDVKTDLIVEAIFENFEVKKELFSKLDKRASEEVIFASNTSSFPISSLSKELPRERRKRFVGLHFFNPAPIMKLVEVIKGHWSDPLLIDDLYNWFDQRGKKPAKCSDSPGFIVNRVARNFYGEALRIAEVEDIGRFHEIDTVMKEVGGFRMGPYELMDLIGIDINYSVTCSVWDSFFKEPRFAPHALQKKMVESGRLGRKTKEGFYNYE
jgi:3-hydroxybutyryl-CoA dehydrogenase